MGAEDRLPPDESTSKRLLYALAAVPTVLGLAHHVDHVVRGNHVGWPVTGHVNEFTYSLGIYPLVAVGVYLTVTDRVGSRYWAGFLAFTAAIVWYFHLSPWAVEPPSDVVVPYADPALGHAAFAVLLALLASVVLGSAYAAVLWRRQRA